MSAADHDTLAGAFQPNRDGLLRRVRVAANRAVRAFDDRYKADRADVIVLSHAKSGRTWLRVMLSHLYETRYGLKQGQMLEFGNLHRQNPAIPRVLFNHGYFLRERIDTYRDQSLLFLVRNPLDVAVSQYFQFTKRTKQRNKDLINNPTGMEQVPMYDFILHPDNKVGLLPIIGYLNDWHGALAGRARVLRVHYEAMHAEPAATLRQILDFIGSEASDEQIAATVAFADAGNLRKLERDNFFKSDRLAPRDANDPDSYKVRRAKVGGYRDYFDAAQIAALEQVVRERLNPIFGYGSPEPAAADLHPDRPAAER